MRPGYRDLRHRPGGFTLVELLVVLAILMALTAIAVPTFSRTPGVEIKAAARAVAAGLRQARSVAITRDSATAFTLDTQQRRFRVGQDRPARRLPEALELALYTARSERLEQAIGAIRFFPDGSSTGGRVTLSLRGRSLAVDVAWLTGRIRILDQDDASGPDPDS